MIPIETSSLQLKKDLSKLEKSIASYWPPNLNWQQNEKSKVLFLKMTNLFLLVMKKASWSVNMIPHLVARIGSICLSSVSSTMVMRSPIQEPPCSSFFLRTSFVSHLLSLRNWFQQQPH
ncbi:hypothetical protein QL285_031854 [Trifolium repens]|nr:hypothetical protein QL285_031854 [Trifolium repens]